MSEAQEREGKPAWAPELERIRLEQDLEGAEAQISRLAERILRAGNLELFIESLKREPGYLHEAVRQEMISDLVHQLIDRMRKTEDAWGVLVPLAVLAKADAAIPEDKWEAHKP